MTETQLFSNKSPHDDGANPDPAPARKRRLPSWAVPASLMLAFAGVFGIAFADRLLPARTVTVAPAILLADIEGGPAAPPAGDGPRAPDAEPDGAGPPGAAALDYSAPMLFQAAGWFEPDPLPRRATALEDGVVEEVFVLEGEAVTAGQRLAKLIDDDARLALAAAQRKLEQTVAEHHMHLAHIPAIEAEAASVEGKIASAQAKLAELADKHRRLLGLSQGTVSEQDLTAARLAVDSQSAALASLRSDLAEVRARLDGIKVQSEVFDAMIAAAEVRVDEAELALARTEIASPVDGVVLELHAAPGQKKLLRMDNPESATVAVLFETGRLQARVDVPLADARGLATGQPAIITSDFLPNAEFRGVVSRIVGSADLQRNTLQAKVRIIDPDPRLRPEMLCRVRFLEPRSNGGGAQGATGGETAPAAGTRAVMAPAAALIDRDRERAAAWVVDAAGSRAARRELELGRLEVDGYLAVRAGLRAGELLILPPHEGLAEGRRIDPRRDDS